MGEVMTKMHNPPHVGEVIKELYLEPKGMSITELARRLGVSRCAASRLVNRKSRLSPKMAIALERVLEGSAEMWFNMQQSYDLWQFKQMRIADLNQHLKTADDKEAIKAERRKVRYSNA
jgi:addiction module HigA family antidote